MVVVYSHNWKQILSIYNNGIRNRVLYKEVIIMKDPKYHIYLTNEERSEVLKSLIYLKNEMIVQGKHTDVLDEIIVKLYKSRKKNIKVIYI